MDTNGDFRKYFDDLNNRLDAKFKAIDKRFDAVDKRFDAVNKRLDAVDERLDVLTAVVGDIKVRVELLDHLTTDMQKVEQLLVQQFEQLNKRVGKIEEALPRIVALIMELGERVARFASGKQLELREVRYDEASQTLTGIIREKQALYKVKRKRHAKTRKR
jgi:tetrahydromethanopterin S-methyltransferase subunit G